MLHIITSCKTYKKDGDNLYVIEQGCVVKKEDIQFSIHKNGEKLVSIPSYKVEKVLLFGNQQITTQAVSMALEKNICFNA